MSHNRILKLIRVLSELTLNELANLGGVGRVRISKIESGAANITHGVLQIYSRVYNCTWQTVQSILDDCNDLNALQIRSIIFQFVQKHFEVIAEKAGQL